MELQELQAEFWQIANEHGLSFNCRPFEGGLKLEKLISTAFIAGRRKANLEHKKASE